MRPLSVLGAADVSLNQVLWDSAVALCAILLVIITWRQVRASRRAARRRALDAAILTPPAREVSEHWEPVKLAAGDRRRLPRRGGNPTPVHLLAPGVDRPQPALVLDRCSGGLRLQVGQPFGIDSALRLQATNAPAGTPWVPVTVRWCEPMGEVCEIGCQFAAALPLNVMLLFG